MLTIRNAVVGGRRGAVLTAAGVAAGQLVWTLASAVGLTALLQTSQTVFLWLKLLGAGYLVYLGELLPQFVPAGWNLFTGFAMLGAAFCSATLVWLSLYAVALDRSVLARPGVRRALDAVAGTVLVALGARLATTSTRVQPSSTLILAMTRTSPGPPVASTDEPSPGPEPRR